MRNESSSDYGRGKRRNSLAILLLLATSLCTAAELNEPIKPLPLQEPVNAQRSALGRMLFVDKRLSHDNTTACVSCHSLKDGGATSLAKAVGVGGRQHALNSPSVFNSTYNFRQGWFGSSESVEQLVGRVVQNQVEFGSSWEEILRKLGADPKVEQDFRKVYPDGLTAANIGNALAEYTRGLTTPNSRFDRYLRGDAAAITLDERRGYELFKKYGCVACHQGVNVGGNMFQKFGVMGDYFKSRGNIQPPDLGRYNDTKREADRHVFKVPSLRNVARTAPYFHDGSIATLQEAVAVMFRYQLGRSAPPEDLELIIKFLGTLDGEPQGTLR